MCISVGDVDTFMSHTVRDGDGAEAHVDQKADVTVPQIMNPDPFHACFSCAAVHFMVKITLGNREDSVVLLDLVKALEIILDTSLSIFIIYDILLILYLSILAFYYPTS